MATAGIRTARTVLTFRKPWLHLFSDYSGLTVVVEKEKGKFPIQLYSIKELAEHYRVSPKTLMRYIRLLKIDLGPRLGNSFSPKQVSMIVDKMGQPFVWIGLMLAKMFLGDVFQDEQQDNGQEDGQKLGRKG